MRNPDHIPQAEAFRDILCAALSSWEEVVGVAQTGDPHAPLVPGMSDIDLFILCRQVPSKKEREARYAALPSKGDGLHMEVCHDEIWGRGDIFSVQGVDVMPMFFDKEAFSAYIDDVLSGNHLYAEGRFYPIGRLATVESIHVFSQKDRAWTDLIEKVQSHPRQLFAQWFAAQSALILDEEDLSRVILRKEVLFYHQVLENALDHFLQALYARNNCYFPSRKRAEAALDAFAIQPPRCKERLLSLLRHSVQQETIDQSVAELRALVRELLAEAEQSQAFS